LTGVETNIQSLMDETKYDLAAVGIMKPVQDLGAVADGIGFAEPQAHTNMLAFLVPDLSFEVSGSIVPVDYGWNTI
jgi:hypothetical protein